jgi:hypothetical protein
LLPCYFLSHIVNFEFSGLAISPKKKSKVETTLRQACAAFRFRELPRRPESVTSTTTSVSPKEATLPNHLEDWTFDLDLCGHGDNTVECPDFELAWETARKNYPVLQYEVEHEHGFSNAAILVPLSEMLRIMGVRVDLRDHDSLGDPDFTVHSHVDIANGSAKKRNIVKKLFVTGELKLHWKFEVPYDSSLVRLTLNCVASLKANLQPVLIELKAYNAVKQLYYYMIINKCTFGILSTLDQTWIFWQSGTGTLKVSQGIHGDDLMRVLVATCLAAKVARENEKHANVDSPDPSIFEQQDSKESGDRPGDSNASGDAGDSCSGSGSITQQRSSGRLGLRSQNAKRTQRACCANDTNMGAKPQQLKSCIHTLPAIYMHPSFGSCECGNGTASPFLDLPRGEVHNGTWKARMGDRHVYIKTVDVSKQLQKFDLMCNELRVYEHLADLQGLSIPRLVYGGWLCGDLLFGIVTESVGDSIERIGVENIGREVKETVMQALTLIHQHGVLHNDIALRNIVCVDGKRHAQKCHHAFFIDFERACISPNRIDSLFGCEEKRAVADILSIYH